MKSLRIALLLSFLVFLTAGCHHEVTPEPIVDIDPIDNFNSSNSIALVNAQPSTNLVVFYSAGIHSFEGNYHLWTETVRQITERELKNRGMKMDGNSSKVLKMAITASLIDVGWVRIDSDVTLNVETSTGYKATYHGHDYAVMAGSYQGQMNTSTQRSVVAMLNDPKIVEFLKQEPTTASTH